MPNPAQKFENFDELQLPYNSLLFAEISHTFPTYQLLQKGVILPNLQRECQTRATRMQYECNTSETRVTRVLRKRHECHTSATRTTRVRHEWKNFNFDNHMSKNIFWHSYINYMASERLQGEEKFHSKY